MLQDILLIVVGLIVGAIIGFFVARKVMEKGIKYKSSFNTKVAKITKEQVRKIAEQKMPDLNAANVESAMSMVAGTARSMGIEVVD